MPQKTCEITIDANGAATFSPTVMPGDRIYFTAGPNSVYVNLPLSILSGNPTSPVNLAAGASSSPYVVNGSQGLGIYSYSSGLSGQSAVTDQIYVGWQIIINQNGAATTSPTVSPGDKVYFTAGSNPAGVYVNLPTIFSGNPTSPIDLSANTNSSPYTVNNNQTAGRYNYSSGIQGQSSVIDTVNDTIDVGTGTDTSAAGA
jgi:hypothetical protein